jgi:hypothetical protein
METRKEIDSELLRSHYVAKKSMFPEPRGHIFIEKLLILLVPFASLAPLPNAFQ